MVRAHVCHCSVTSTCLDNIHTYNHTAGSGDKRGKVVSERLQNLSNAKVVEVEGSHSCYFDSPDVFIQDLLSFLPVG